MEAILSVIPDWLLVIFGAGGVVTLIVGILVFVATRKRDTSTDLASRFGDATKLSQYIREEIEEEVERQVAPIRVELQTVKDESHEMNDAVRTNVTQQWLWDQKGRLGELPMLPGPILTKLGLGYFADDWPTEPTSTT